jgi:3-hydroxyacyl-[acyl-carrier-protein] dehydratase
VSRALTADEVAALLPHAPPLRLVDDAPELVAGERVRARWLVPLESFWTAAHFPGRPVLPGVLLIEALAQACALVWRSQPGAVGLPALVGVDGVRLRAPVRPGDEVALEAIAVERRRLWRFAVKATVGDRVVAEGTLLATSVPA